MNLEYKTIFLRQLLKNVHSFQSLAQIKYFGKWQKSLDRGKSPMSDRQPWLTFQAIEYIQRKINPSDKVFEYGGGGSTLFFLDKGVQTITVEHDKVWFDILTEKVKNNNLGNLWKGILEPAEQDSDIGANLASDPDSYSSSSNEYLNYNFVNYVRSIDLFPDNYFDFVIIDGRSRPSCIKHAVKKVKDGGFLVLDNAERDYYLTSKTLKYLKNFKLKINLTGPSPYVVLFTKTYIWRKML